MQTENRLFDDFAKIAGGALNALTGLKTEVEAQIRQQMEHFLGTMNLVTRDEFEAVQAMAAKARDEQEALNLRLARVEAQLAASKGGGAAASVAKRPRKTKSATTTETTSESS